MPRPTTKWKLTEEQARVVEDNRWLAVGYARRHHERHRLDRDDAVSVCFLALCRAVHGFDPGRRLKLSTYVYPIMERAMRRESGRLPIIPTPRYDDPARAARLSPDLARQAELVRDMPRARSDSLGRLAVAHDPGPEPDVSGRVLAALATLGPGSRRLVERIVMGGEGGASVAAELGVSRQAVNQAKEHALSLLRRRLEGMG